MISTIVVGTDGSQTAGRAVAVAADMARAMGARVHLVHGYHVPGEESGGRSVAAAAGNVWRDASEALLADAAAQPPLAGLEVECHSVPGGASHALLDVARVVGADLIVVGNRGITRPDGARNVESVPELVLHEAPCHVLVAKTT